MLHHKDRTWKIQKNFTRRLGPRRCKSQHNSKVLLWYTRLFFNLVDHVYGDIWAHHVFAQNWPEFLIHLHMFLRLVWLLTARLLADSKLAHTFHSIFLMPIIISWKCFKYDYSFLIKNLFLYSNCSFLTKKTKLILKKKRKKKTKNICFYSISIIVQKVMCIQGKNFQT